MHRSVLSAAFVLVALAASAQTPQPRLSYDDRSGTTGHTITVDGKSFGPYKDITSINFSTTGTAGIFLVTKRDKSYVIAQGKEFGPLTAGYDVDQTWISDDGKLWAVTASQYEEGEDGEDGMSRTVLWVNGKSYGPYTSVDHFSYSETGGRWLASVRQDDETAEVLLDGKSKGTSSSVDGVWMFPDGKAWGWVSTDPEGRSTLVTQDRSYEALQSVNVDQMEPRNAHWAYSMRIADEEEVIVVDGRTYTGYLNFSGLTLSTSGRHWGFQAEKLTDSGDFPVVVIDGKEYVGEGLGVTNLGDKESFTWSVKEGDQVKYLALPLP